MSLIHGYSVVPENHLLGAEQAGRAWELYWKPPEKALHFTAESFPQLVNGIVL